MSRVGGILNNPKVSKEVVSYGSKDQVRRNYKVLIWILEEYIQVCIISSNGVTPAGTLKKNANGVQQMTAGHRC